MTNNQSIHHAYEPFFKFEPWDKMPDRGPAVAGDLLSLILIVISIETIALGELIPIGESTLLEEDDLAASGVSDKLCIPGRGEPYFLDAKDGVEELVGRGNFRPVAKRTSRWRERLFLVDSFTKRCRLGGVISGLVPNELIELPAVKSGTDLVRLRRRGDSNGPWKWSASPSAGWS